MIHQPPIPNINTKMLPHTPRYAIQIFRGKNRPDEEMRPQRRARKHHEKNTT